MRPLDNGLLWETDALWGRESNSRINMILLYAVNTGAITGCVEGCSSLVQ